MEYGFLSVIPPIVAIILALRTKQVYIALLFGIWFSWLIIKGWNPLDGTLAMIEGLVNVFQSKGNTRTIMFSALVGSLLIFIQYSRGVEGFINIINKTKNFSPQLLIIFYNIFDDAQTQSHSARFGGKFGFKNSIKIL